MTTTFITEAAAGLPISAKTSTNGLASLVTRLSRAGQRGFACLPAVVRRRAE